MDLAIIVLIEVIRERQTSHGMLVTFAALQSLSPLRRRSESLRVTQSPLLLSFFISISLGLFFFSPRFLTLFFHFEHILCHLILYDCSVCVCEFWRASLLPES